MANKLLLTLDEILNELRIIGFDIIKESDGYNCTLADGDFFITGTIQVSIFIFLESKKIRFYSSINNGLCVGGLNGPILDIDFITIKSLHGALSGFSPYIKNVIRNKKISNLLSD